MQNRKRPTVHRSKVYSRRNARKEPEINTVTSFDKFMRRVLLASALFLMLLVGEKSDVGISLSIFKDYISHHVNVYSAVSWYEEKFGNIFPNEESVLEVSATPITLDNTSIFGNGIIVKMDSINPVKSYSDGVVVFKGYKKGFGKTIIIQSDNGLEYWYSYMYDINVGLYSHIEKNQVLGFAQLNELNSDYANLYLAIHDGKEFIDVLEAMGYAKD